MEETTYTTKIQKSYSESTCSTAVDSTTVEAVYLNQPLEMCTTNTFGDNVFYACNQENHLEEYNFGDQTCSTDIESASNYEVVDLMNNNCILNSETNKYYFMEWAGACAYSGKFFDSYILFSKVNTEVPLISKIQMSLVFANFKDFPLVFFWFFLSWRCIITTKRHKTKRKEWYSSENEVKSNVFAKNQVMLRKKIQDKEKGIFF